MKTTVPFTIKTLQWCLFISIYAQVICCSKSRDKKAYESSKVESTDKVSNLELIKFTYTTLGEDGEILDAYQSNSDSFRSIYNSKDIVGDTLNIVSVMLANCCSNLEGRVHMENDTLFLGYSKTNSDECACEKIALLHYSILLNERLHQDITIQYLKEIYRIADFDDFK